MRWRAAAGALGAAALAGAVVVLRGQVPPAPEPPPAAAAPAVTVADPGLPVLEPERGPRWRVHSAPFNAIDGVATREHLLYTRATGERLELTIERRITGQHLFQHAVPFDEGPSASLLHEDRLLVVHGRSPVRLAAVEPATGQVRELAPPAGYGFRPRLAELGEEVVLAGWRDEPRQSCVLAVRPSTGASRVVWCAEHGLPSIWLYAGVNEVVWPAGANPTGCVQWQRLRAGGEAEPVSHRAALCAARAVLELDGWQIAQHPERDVLQPMIIAGDGSRQLALGAAATFTGCGRHVYWSAATHGINPDTVYRWLPGTEYREVAYRLPQSSRLQLASPRCAGGVLSVAVTTANDGDPRVVELRSLGRP